MPFFLKKGDLLPRLRSTLKSPDGTAIDLTGATVTLRMKLVTGGALKVNSAGVVVSASAGIVEYVWTAPDVNAAGSYQAEWVLNFSGNLQTVPNGGFIEVIISDSLV